MKKIISLILLLACASTVFAYPFKFTAVKKIPTTIPIDYIARQVYNVQNISNSDQLMFLFKLNIYKKVDVFAFSPYGNNVCYDGYILLPLQNCQITTEANTHPAITGVTDADLYLYYGQTGQHKVLIYNIHYTVTNPFNK